MSATNRKRAQIDLVPGTGHERERDDFYATPIHVTAAILPHLPFAGSVLEPCAGDGAIVRALLAGGVDEGCIDAIELDPGRANKARELVDVLVGDALKPRELSSPTDACRLWDAPHGLVIMNPPFKLAEEFVRRAIEAQAPHRGTTAALVRIGFLAAAKRRDLVAAGGFDVFLLSPRPSFTANGGNDSAEYAWVVAGPGRGGRFEVLHAPTPKRARKDVLPAEAAGEGATP